jgi:hypothetical protein
MSGLWNRLSGSLRENASGVAGSLKEKASGLVEQGQGLINGNLSNRAQGTFSDVRTFLKEKNPFKSKPTTTEMMERRIGSITDFYNKDLPINHYDKNNYGTFLPREYYLKYENGTKLFIGKVTNVEFKKIFSDEDYYLVHFENSDGKETTLTKENISDGSIYYEVQVPSGGRRTRGKRRITKGITRGRRRRISKKQTYRRRNINSK